MYFSFKNEHISYIYVYIKPVDFNWIEIRISTKLMNKSKHSTETKIDRRKKKR